VGMHNGTLRECDFKSENGKTDSEAMFAAMDVEGVVPILSRLHKESAYAIVVYDKLKKEFYIARNEHRSLFVTWNSNRRVLYYASEYGQLDWVLNRRGIKR